MRTHRSPAAAGAVLVPPVLATWLSAFRDCFTAPVWKHVLVLGLRMAMIGMAGRDPLSA